MPEDVSGFPAPSEDQRSACVRWVAWASDSETAEMGKSLASLYGREVARAIVYDAHVLRREEDGRRESMSSRTNPSTNRYRSY